MSPGALGSRWVPVALLGALLLAGCGGGTTASRLAAAEPAHDDQLTQAPAGHSVRVGAEPQGIAVQSAGGIVAVGVRDPVSVRLLSARSGTPIGRIAISGAPRHLAVASMRGPLLVPEERRDRLLELSLPSGVRHSYRVGSFPHAVAAAGDHVYVGNEQGGSLSEITHGRVRTIGGFTQPGGLAALGHDLAVVDVARFTLTLLDTRTNRVLGHLPAGRGPTHDVAAGGRIYVADTRGNALLTYGVAPFRRIGRTAMGTSPYGIAIDPARHRLWVTETGQNRLAELTLAGRLPRVVAQYPTGRQPDTVAVDPASGRVFVANQVSGTVQMITPRR